VVRHEVDEHTDPVSGGLGDELLRVGRGAEPFVDPAVVGDVVAAVVQWRAVPRVDPHGVDPELRGIPAATRMPAMSPVPSPLPSANERT
jgi:hypothetical protein